MNQRHSHNPWIKLIALTAGCAFLLQDLSAAAVTLAPNTALPSISEPKAHFDIPDSIALVEDVYHSNPGGWAGEKSIVLIQDAHTNASAQVNLSKALDLVLRKESIRHVFLEAGEGDLSLSFLRTSAPKEKVREIALSYVRKGLLQGSEYLDLVSDLDFRLWGVEDQTLYARALNTYRAIVDQRNRFKTYLNRIDRLTAVLKPKIYNRHLQIFDQKVSGYRRHEKLMTDYNKDLMAFARKLEIDLKHYPHLKALSKLTAKEESLDFVKASLDQDRAVKHLSPEDRKELLELSRTSHTPSSRNLVDDVFGRAFYALLESKMDSEGGRDSYPELFEYFVYLKEAKRIDPKQILDESGALEQAIYGKLMWTQDERDLFEAEEGLRGLQKLIDLTLEPSEFEDQEARPSKFDAVYITGFLNKKIMDLRNYYDQAVFLEEGLEDIIRKSREFYELTQMRDEAFLERMFAKMDREGERKAVLITGGYHAPNLKRMLKTRGASYISIIPQVLHETDHKRYETLLLAQPLVPVTRSDPGPGREGFRLAQSQMMIQQSLQVLWNLIDDGGSWNPPDAEHTPLLTSLALGLGPGARSALQEKIVSRQLQVRTPGSRTSFLNDLTRFKELLEEGNVISAKPIARRIHLLYQSSPEIQLLYTLLSNYKFAGGVRKEWAMDIARALGIEHELQKSRVLVTGGTTYLARKMIDKLIREGHQVVVLAPEIAQDPEYDQKTQIQDRQIRYGRQKLKDYDNDPRVQVIDADYTKGFNLEDPFGTVEGSIEKIYHFPSVTSQSQVDRGLGLYALFESVYGMDHLLQFAQRSGAEFIDISSVLDIGDPDHPSAQAALAESGGAVGRPIPLRFKGYSDQTDVLAETSKGTKTWTLSVGDAEMNVSGKAVRVGYFLGSDMTVNDLDDTSRLSRALVAMHRLGQLMELKIGYEAHGPSRALDEVNREIEETKVSLRVYDGAFNIADVEDVVDGIYNFGNNYRYPQGTEPQDKLINLGAVSPVPNEKVFDILESGLKGWGLGEHFSWGALAPGVEAGYKAPEAIDLDTSRAKDLLGYTPKGNGLVLLQNLVNRFRAPGLNSKAPENMITESLFKLAPSASVTAEPSGQVTVLSFNNALDMNPGFREDSSKEVAVIGGGMGFIGLNLAKGYVDAGKQVILLDNLSVGLEANLKRLLASDPKYKANIAPIRFDLTQKFTLADTIRVLAIHHGASLPSPPFYYTNRAATARSGVHIAENLIELALKFSFIQGADVPVVEYGSSEEYGDPKVHPQPEDYLGNVDSVGSWAMYYELAKRFLLTHASSKYRAKYPALIPGVQTWGLMRTQAEQIALAHGAKHLGKNLGYVKYVTRPDPAHGPNAYMVTYQPADIRIVRISNTFGRFNRIDDGRVVTNFFKQAFGQALHALGLQEEPGEAITVEGDGTQTRSFLWVDDQVKALMALADPDAPLKDDYLRGGVVVVNSGADNEVSEIGMRQLADHIAELVKEWVVVDKDFEVKIDHVNWNSILVGNFRHGNGLKTGTVSAVSLPKEEAEAIRDRANTEALRDGQMQKNEEKYILWPDNDDSSLFMVVERKYRGGVDSGQSRLRTDFMQEILGHPVSSTNVKAGIRKLLFEFLTMDSLTASTTDRQTHETRIRTYNYRKLPINGRTIIDLLSDPEKSKTVDTEEARYIVPLFVRSGAYQSASEDRRKHILDLLLGAAKGSYSNLPTESARIIQEDVRALGIAGTRFSDNEGYDDRSLPAPLAAYERNLDEIREVLRNEGASGTHYSGYLMHQRTEDDNFGQAQSATSRIGGTRSALHSETEISRAFQERFVPDFYVPVVRAAGLRLAYRSTIALTTEFRRRPLVAELVTHDGSILIKPQDDTLNEFEANLEMDSAPRTLFRGRGVTRLMDYMEGQQHRRTAMNSLVSVDTRPYVGVISLRLLEALDLDDVSDAKEFDDYVKLLSWKTLQHGSIAFIGGGEHKDRAIQLANETHERLTRLKRARGTVLTGSSYPENAIFTVLHAYGDETETGIVEANLRVLGLNNHRQDVLNVFARVLPKALHARGLFDIPSIADTMAAIGLTTRPQLSEAGEVVITDVRSGTLDIWRTGIRQSDFGADEAKLILIGTEVHNGQNLAWKRSFGPLPVDYDQRFHRAMMREMGDTSA